MRPRTTLAPHPAVALRRWVLEDWKVRGNGVCAVSSLVVSISGWALAVALDSAYPDDTGAPFWAWILFIVGVVAGILGLLATFVFVGECVSARGVRKRRRRLEERERSMQRLRESMR